MPHKNGDKSLGSWLWDAASKICGVHNGSKYMDFVLPLVFAKRFCDVFDDEINRIAKGVGGRVKAFKLAVHDKQLVRFLIPLKPKTAEEPVRSVTRLLTNKIGEQLSASCLDTSAVRAAARLE